MSINEMHVLIIINALININPLSIKNMNYL